MHPLLIVTYLLNLILIGSIFGLLGVFLGIIGSALVFYIISKNGGDVRKHWGQIAAIAFVHFLGVIAVVYAPWGSSVITGVAIIMELFIVAIFSNMGRV
ncbi:hypothetical protein A2886_02050 [candidate division WWE3 bacterium RIFCSPHIGHO2_01_FULL_42_13]|uniref:Uncharacterized protein n=1 Tax=candidate division WWE3 bacterium RIFCSPHIGHO2_01_FULL_42_13 TaxID=1802617 RepID=A0A1F4URY1_UNCKA|nr:MAG: hypothetical protein A2886_02050 [candidate division WWE3 bacterium RIFCSPHIGHO2_01_FULL_42_13]